MKWFPEHIIISGIAAACVALIACGIDGEVKSILALSVGWLFRALMDARISKPKGE